MRLLKQEIIEDAIMLLRARRITSIDNFQDGETLDVIADIDFKIKYLENLLCTLKMKNATT